MSALWVFTAHVSWYEFSGDVIAIFRGDGNRGVIVFFVLSGFVIKYVSATKEKTLSEYLLSRLARLYSVILPILGVMTAIYVYFLIENDVILDQHKIYTFDILKSYISTLFFFNEIWFISWSPPLNGPLWSLSYEFWFYALFAALVYLDGRARAVAAIVIVLISGPKILLLIIPWFMGTYGYMLISARSINPVIGLLIWVLSFFVIILAYAVGIEASLDEITRNMIPEGIYWRLGNSQNFLNYLFFGFLWIMNLIGFASISYNITINPNIEKIITELSNCTFSLYLLHLPLLYFIVEISGVRFEKPAACVFLMVFILVVAYVFSFATERKKADVKVWLTMLKRRILGEGVGWAKTPPD